MRNVSMKVEGDTLVIRVDIKKRMGPSKSGKTIVIASTEGNQRLPENERVCVGVNVYEELPKV